MHFGRTTLSGNPQTQKHQTSNSDKPYTWEYTDPSGLQVPWAKTHWKENEIAIHTDMALPINDLDRVTIIIGIHNDSQRRVTEAE